MESNVIRTLRPNVTREEALRTFASPGPAALFWRVRGGQLQRVADVYLPYRVYPVRYRLGGSECRHVFALDAVNGSLDLFEFAEPPGNAEMIAVSTRNCPSPALSEQLSLQLLREKVFRIVFQQGFFKLRQPKLDVELLPGQIHLPYWLGFYGSRDHLRCRVLDAVRCHFEGAKASALFEHWLAS